MVERVSKVKGLGREEGFRRQKGLEGEGACQRAEAGQIVGLGREQGLSRC